MVGGYTANKNLYQTALLGGGGSGSTKIKKPTTGGTYANGIAGLTQTTPTVKMPNITSQLNSGVVRPVYADGLGYGGGYAGGITKEGVISGGGAVNTTFNSGNKVIKGGLGVTKLPNAGSAQIKYGDNISSFIKLPSAKDNITTPVMTAQKTGATTTPTQGSSTETEKKTPATYEEYLEQQRELLDKRKTEADRQAEAAKERAAVDAQASYAQNMASYGTNAENLAQMGLQGGGYSDYLNAQAYAQKRADVQQANVTEQAAKAQNTATYEDALSEINKSDIEYQEKQKEKAAALKQSALDAINQGSLNESNIGSYLDSLKGLGATDNDVADIKETYQKNFYNEYLAQITSGGEQFSTKAVDDAYNAGNLSKEHYESLKKAWNDDIDPNILLNSTDNHETVKKAYEEYINNSWCTAEKKAALKKAFDGYEAKHYKSDVSTGYNAHSSTVTLNTPDGKVTVTYGVNSKTLKKSSGNAVFNTDIYKNAGSGQVFIVNGRPYVKLDNGDLGWVNDYLGRGALEQLRDTYDGTVYDIS